MNKLFKKIKPWWSDEYGFFGSFYFEGDDSIEGYLDKEPLNLKQRTKVEVSGVVSILKLKKKSKVLDIPCGYGRHSNMLSQMEHEVVGVDINLEHLKKAKEEASNLGVSSRFITKSMIDIDFSEEFDAVINMFYSFGFFKTDKENNKVLQNFYNALKPGGKFLMHTDVNISRVISGKYKFNESRNLKSGNTLLINEKYIPRTKRIMGSWTIKKQDGKSLKKKYSVRVYAEQEFINMCKRVGFKSFESYGNWDGSSLTKNSEDMMIVATK